MKKLYTLSAIIFLNFSIAAQIVTIPDVNFKNAVLNHDPAIDTNGDDEIQLNEALAVTALHLNNKEISSLEGISNFLNVTWLECTDNNLTTLDISGLPLMHLFCYNNQLTSLTFNNDLKALYCANNALTTLDLTGLSMIALDVSYNQLPTLSIPPFDPDTWVNNYQYGLIGISGNLYTEIENMPIGTDSFRCDNTLLTSLKLPGMEFGSDENNSVQNNANLQFIDAKNGYPVPLCVFSNESYGCHQTIANNPQLQLICVPDGYLDLTELLEYFANLNNPNLAFTTYCHFTPGGYYNTVTGNIKIDIGGDGCTLEDGAAPGIRINSLSVPGFYDEGSTTTNSFGQFFSYTNLNLNKKLTPQFENPYFTIVPSEFISSFSGFGNTATADFCITPNGIHPDLEITLLPLEAARPGFDADYQLVYKNKGTQVQSGSVNLIFNDAVLDLVSATPNTSTESANNLSWDFTDLSPFETRTFNFTLNVNSPMETPAVNINDVLAFSASILTAETDETPDDNVIAFNQIVVGSFDPNDKAVVEGSQIDITNVGDYLHYVVRFQNSGTAPAENVVIKDLLADNLDKSTLQILSASHPYQSTLTVGNKLEFFFEGINLPPAITDEPGSHGYVAFKIKPSSTVAIGSIIENTASIYFDFNYPIVTNTVSTTVTTLGNQQFDINDSFTMYPNPAVNVLNIEMITTSVIKHVNIYNTLGQLVKSSDNANGENKMTLAVDGINAGAYLVEIISSTGKSIQKIIKL